MPTKIEFEVSGSFDVEKAIELGEQLCDAPATADLLVDLRSASPINPCAIVALIPAIRSLGRTIRSAHSGRGAGVFWLDATEVARIAA